MWLNSLRSVGFEVNFNFKLPFEFAFLKELWIWVNGAAEGLQRFALGGVEFNYLTIDYSSHFPLSHFCAAISKDDTDESTNLGRGKNKMPFNGFSEEYLDRLDNGNLPGDNKSYTKRELSALHIIWSCKILSNINRNCFSFSPLFLPMILEKKQQNSPQTSSMGKFIDNYQCLQTANCSTTI